MAVAWRRRLPTDRGAFCLAVSRACRAYSRGDGPDCKLSRYQCPDVGRDDDKATKRPPPLQRLPLPCLEETVDSYLRIAKSIVSVPEYYSTKEHTRQFLAECGTGRILQKILEDKAQNTENWFNDSWMETVLKSRLPLVVHSNNAYLLPRQQFRNTEKYVNFAAKMILATLEFKRLVDKGQVHALDAQECPTDASQYSLMFGTCREPGSSQDYVSTLGTRLPRHIVVAHNNQLFMLTVLDEQCRALSHRQLVAALYMLMEQSPEPIPAVGALTSIRRDAWARLHRQLAGERLNRCSLEIIRRSLFMLCLDGAESQLAACNMQTAAGMLAVHGGGGTEAHGGNRWHDKGIQLVVGRSGEVAILSEPSLVDPSAMAQLVDHVSAVIEQRDPICIVTDPVHFFQPERVDFQLDNRMLEQVRSAQENLDRVAEDVDMHCSTFTAYGTDWMRHVGMNPESYMQMALNLAFSRVHGSVASHQQTVCMRAFHRGRTDVVHCTSLEAARLCRVMSERSTKASQRYAALLAAVNSHKQEAALVRYGRGVDRHLLALRVAAERTGLPLSPLFSEPVYRKLTSPLVASTPLPLCYNGMLIRGPKVRNGYGCSYNARCCTVNVSVVALRSGASRGAQCLYCSLRDSLLDMRNAIVCSRQ